MNTEQVTVVGHVFTMPNPFEEGHVLTEGEAGQLNQVYHENIRNNIAKKVKDAITAGSFTVEAFQAQIDKMCEEYEFGKRRAGGPRAPSDPVAKEALRLAIDAISNKLRADGKKPSDFSNIKELAATLVSKNPAFTEKAKEIVAERQAMADAALGDLMSGLVEKPAEAPKPAETPAA